MQMMYAGKNIRRLEDALKALPQKMPYQEAAKALRKMFAERVNGDGMICSSRFLVGG
jgi:hypothetical protein